MTLANTGMGVCTSLFNWASAKPIRIPVTIGGVGASIVVAGVCAAYLFQPYTKDCSGDKVALSGNVVSYATHEGGHIQFPVANPPVTNKTCVSEISPTDAKAFDQSYQQSWADFKHFKNAGG